MVIPLRVSSRDASRRRRATAARLRRRRARAAGRFRPSAFITPRSVCGNASGQASARIAMYCAVHSPTPGSARSLLQRRLDVGVRHQHELAVGHRAREREHACGRARRACRGARCARRAASAMRAAVGKTVVSEAKGVSSGSPNAAAKRPATVRAAATVTCWPRIARTATSKPSNAPGTRRPGWRLRERAQRLRHLGRIAGEVHQRLDAREHRRQRLGERGGHRDAQRGLLRRERDLDPAAMLLAVHARRARCAGSSRPRPPRRRRWRARRGRR